MTPRAHGVTVGTCLTAQASHAGPRDANQRAKLIVDIATGQIEDQDPDEGKNPAAVELGRHSLQLVPTPTLRELTVRVHRLAKEDPDCITYGVITYGVHLQDRMRQRGKTTAMRDILETLKNGEGVKGPEVDKYGDFRIKLKRCVSGKRLQVVVAVRDKDLSVVTVV